MPALASAQEMFAPPVMDYGQHCKVMAVSPQEASFGSADQARIIAQLEKQITHSRGEKRMKAKFQLAKLLRIADPEQAVALLHEVLPEDPFSAGAALGDYYLAEEQPQEAEGFYRRAAAAGSARAMLMLARLYGQKKVEPPSPDAAQTMREQARNLLLSELAEGRCGALRDIGMMLLTPAYGGYDEALGRQWLQAAAEAGDIPAMLELAGRRKPEWLQVAAKAGSAEAMFRLGKAAVQNAEAAGLDWLEQASGKHHAEAVEMLIDAYRGRYAFPADKEKARNWLQRLADADAATAEQRYWLAERVPEEDKAFALYREAALGGNREARVKLGDAYKYGRGVAADPIQSYRYYRLAAGEGSRDAMMALAANYRCGVGRAADKRLADRWLRYARQDGARKALESEAKRMLRSKKELDHQAVVELLQRWVKQEEARMSRDKSAIENRMPKALLYAATQDSQWEAKASAPGKGQKGGMLALAELALERSEKAIARKWLQQAMQQGSRKAMRELAQLAEADGNAAKAAALYRRAAEAGDGEAAANLGRLLLASEPEAGRKWLHRAAAAGEVEAMLDLSGYYLQAEDTAQAMQWMDKAAAQLPCHADARADLEKLQDRLLPLKSPEQLEAAAARGSTAAMRQLAKQALYRGVSGQAIRWYEKAASRGDDRAMLELGNAYLLGLGVERSSGKARQYWQQAAQAGNADAKRLVAEAQN